MWKIGDDTNYPIGAKWVNCFTSLFAQSWQHRERRKLEAGAMAHSYLMTSRVRYSVQCTTSIINVRPGRDSKPVPLSFEHNRTEWEIWVDLYGWIIQYDETLNRCWFNVGPAWQTVAHTFIVAWVGSVTQRVNDDYSAVQSQRLILQSQTAVGLSAYFAKSKCSTIK